MKRDCRVELYRCLCMAGVVLLHSLTQGGYADAHRGLDNLVTPSVVGFVFISGYYGISFRLKSVARLLGVGAASWVALAMISGKFDSSFGISGYWWFLWMYLALMAFAPLVNAIFVGNVQWGCVIRKLVPLWLVVYMWSYAATVVPVLKNFVPVVGGFSPFGVITFIATYAAARASRMCEDRLDTKMLLLLGFGSGAMCWIGFYHYSSPFALIFAGSMFYLFKRIPESRGIDIIGRMASVLGPSLFSVYLLHTNTYGFKLLREAEDYLVARDVNFYLMAFGVASAIFVGCIALDVPRRIVVRILCSRNFKTTGYNVR